MPRKIHIVGIGVRGPGLSDWPHTRERLLRRGGDIPTTDTPIGIGALLPPTERRRATAVTRLALDVAQEAMGNHDPADIPSIFASSGGEVDIVHQIFTTLAGPDRRLSPTAFHNSVHNAAAGYWSIASGSKMPTDSVCAYDDSFGSGLLEGLLRLQDPTLRVLVVAYDHPAPYPISDFRSMPSAFAVALLLSLNPQDESMAAIDWWYEDGEAHVDPLDEPGLEILRSSNPAARALLLLEAIARGESKVVPLGVGMRGVLRLKVTPCR